MHIVALYSAILALLLVYLSFYTIATRRRLKIGLGDDDNMEMRRAIRVHANCAEYAPMGLILLACVEWQQPSELWTHALGITLLLGRFLHAYGLATAKFPFRFSGMILTFSMMLLAAVYLIYCFLAA